VEKKQPAQSSFLRFTDNTPPEVDDESRIFNDSSIAYEHPGDFKDFFSRPINIATLQWYENTVRPTSFLRPWRDYFMHSAIYPKLRGFSRLRAKLHIKVNISGTPFKYGCLMMSYRPLCNLSHTSVSTPGLCPFFSGGQIAGDSTDAYPGGAAPGSALSDASSIMARSQRQHIKILPQFSQGGELVLPFEYHTDHIEISTQAATDIMLQEMGTLVTEEVVVLRSSGTTDANPVTVSIYAWATDVQIWGPTSVSVQSKGKVKDENADAADTLPSAMASSIADAAGMLEGVPPIAPLAMATRMAARATSKVLSHFGWSNPPLLEAPRGVTPTSVLTNPSTDISRFTPVLALDSMNEVSVDPGIAGCKRSDELNIAAFAARPCLIDTITWNSSDAEDFTLFSIPVTPEQFRFQSVTNTGTGTMPCKRFTMTPACYLCPLFRYYRGTFCIRVTAVCSQFHRGRLAFSHDPISVAPPQSVGNGRLVTEIFDLANGTEIIYKVPWRSSYGMDNMDTGFLSQTPFGSATPTCWGNRSATSSSASANYIGGAFPDPAGANGVVFINVANKLACSDDSSPISLLVEVWWEDYQVAVRRAGYGNDGAYASSDYANTLFTNTVVQADIALDPVPAPIGPIVVDIPIEPFTIITEVQADTLVAEETQEGGESGHTVDILGELYAGESIKSIRNLLHSSQLWLIKPIDLYVANDGSQCRRWHQSTYLTNPLPRGLVTNFTTCSKQTLDLATLSGTGSVSFPMQLTTPLSWITACFTGVRGSYEWRAGSTGNSQAASMCCLSQRVSYAADWTFTEQYNALSGTDNINQRRVMAMLGNGALSTNQIQTQGSTSAVFPYYSRKRMKAANPAAYRYSTMQNLVGGTIQDMAAAMFSYTAQHQDLGSSGTELMLSVAAGKDFNVFGFVNIPDIYLPAWPASY